MATEESKATERKPPAHEVIVALLWRFADTVQREASDASHNPEIVASHVGFVCCAQMLVIVLMRMHIPEKDRQWVVDALHRLPRDFFPPSAKDIFAEIEGDKRGA